MYATPGRISAPLSQALVAESSSSGSPVSAVQNSRPPFNSNRACSAATADSVHADSLHAELGSLRRLKLCGVHLALTRPHSNVHA